MPIILTQTDTTVGFLSQNETKLFEIKSRDTTKQFLKVYKSFKEFSKNSRVPKSKRKLVRNSKKTSFIVKNQAFRISNNSLDSQILHNYGWNYSTSANESAKKFNREFCESKADIIIENSDRLSEQKASSLLKINNTKIRKLR
jgi:tRNA A37 threonylcarbamoyladenosine synthetase subunit TsaC/SUA5/YrdC